MRMQPIPGITRIDGEAFLGVEMVELWSRSESQYRSDVIYCADSSS